MVRRKKFETTGRRVIFFGVAILMTLVIWAFFLKFEAFHVLVFVCSTVNLAQENSP